MELRAGVGVKGNTREHTNEEHALLFISPEENVTKIGCCSIGCSAVILLQRHAVYFHKAYVFGQIKAMSVVMWRKLSEILQHPCAPKSCHTGCIFMVRSVKECFPLSDFSYSCGAHEYIMTSLYPVHQWRQTGEQWGGVELHVFCHNSITFSTDVSKQTPTYRKPLTGGRLKRR